MTRTRKKPSHIDSGELRYFVREVERQTKFALLAAEELRVWLEPGKGNTEDRVDREWAAIQALLTAVGCLAYLFWPNEKGSPNRGAVLRTLFSLGEGSALRRFWHLRNSVVHFDNELDVYLKGAVDETFVDSNIGPPPEAAFGADGARVLRHFNPISWSLTFRDTTYDMEPLLREIATIFDRAGALTNQITSGVDVQRVAGIGRS